MVGVKSNIDWRWVMRLLEYLFFKYYYFQVKVGDENIAEYSALLCISVIIESLYADVLGFYFFFIPSSRNYSVPSIYSVITLFVLSFVILYLLLVHKNKYEFILEKNKVRLKGKKNLGAILFFVVPIVLFFVELFVAIKLKP